MNGRNERQRPTPKQYDFSHSHSFQIGFVTCRQSQARATANLRHDWVDDDRRSGVALAWLGIEEFVARSIRHRQRHRTFQRGVLLWRLRAEASGAATSEQVDAVEHRAAKWVGYSLYAFVVYVVFNSGYGLFVAKRITDTHESVWGILIGVVAKIGMPILAGYKLKVAARLNSRALRADAVESIVCGYLSIVLMVGLAATRILGWWWLDSVAALALIPFIIKEARAAISGEPCSACAEIGPT